jgi:copper chaperone NosL
MRKSKVLMLVGALLLSSLFVLPLWNITLEAPQYPEPIGMDIHINKLADMNPNDIKNINIMNHYVGMKEIPETLPEFKLFPFVVIGMIVLGLIIGFKLNYKWYLVWFLLMVVVGSLGMYDFYLWEYDYGHSLDPKAAIQFQNPDGSPLAYQPPLLGTKTILNFIAHSYPRSGGYLLFTGMFLSLIAFFVGRKEANKLA